MSLFDLFVSFVVSRKKSEAVEYLLEGEVGVGLAEYLFLYFQKSRHLKNQNLAI